MMEKPAPFPSLQLMDGNAATIWRIMKNKKEEKNLKCLFVHVGEMVAEVMYQQHISKYDFAEIIGTDPSNIYRILKKDSLEINQLYRYSKELNHNFFKDLSDEFEKKNGGAL